MVRRSFRERPNAVKRTADPIPLDRRHDPAESVANRAFRAGYNRKRIRTPGLCRFAAAPLTGADIRALTDRTLWARFGEATLKAPHAAQWRSDNGPQDTTTATVL